MLSTYRLAVPLGTILIALAGCSSPLMAPHAPTLSAPQGQQALASAVDCCTSLSNLPYRPITAQDTLSLALTPETPAHDFGNGKSFFHAFELPQNNGPIALSITSPIRDGQVFAPTILVLDSAFQPVREISSDSLTVRRPTGFTTARLTGEFSLTPGPDAQYLVIYTSDRDRQASTQYESEEKAYARVRGLAPPAVPDPVATHAATGDIELDVTSLTSGSIMSSSPRTPAPMVAAPASQPATQSAPRSTVQPATAAANDQDFDYHRMIDAALKAGDVELALELAERAERTGHTGTRAWLAERLQARTP